MNFKKINNKKGFTLIEFIFYIALFGVFFTSLFFTLDIFYKNKIKNRTVLEVEQQGLFISQIIGQEVRNAQDVNIPIISDSGPILSLESFDPVRNPIDFYLNDEKIFISEGLIVENISSDKVIVSDLNFINNSIVDGIKIINFSFTISYNSDSVRNEYQYSKDFFASVNLNKK